MVRFYIVLFITKFIAKIVNIIDKQKGTNISGKIAVKLCPDFVAKFKNIDSDKTVFVTGTDGKTTTTNMIAYVVRESGKKVATNSEGANLLQGVATTLIKNSKLSGKFNKEYLILEIDERSLPKVYNVLKAKHLVITNLEKDQVQRNGEPDYIYKIFEKVINKDMTIYLNNEEPRSKALERKAGKVVYFGLEKNSKSFEKNSFYDISIPCPKCSSKIIYEYYNLENIGKFKCINCDHKSEDIPDIYVQNINYEEKTFTIEEETYKINNAIAFYIYNYAAIVAICKGLGLKLEDIKQGISSFKNPQERREIITYKGKNIKYLRMKQENPKTLQNALDTIAEDKESKVIFIGLHKVENFPPYYTNTFYFFDCDFDKVVKSGVEKYISFSDTVAYDCANRIVYAGEEKDKIEIVETDNYELVLPELDKFETTNVYFITGMKAYEEIIKLIKKAK